MPVQVSAIMGPPVPVTVYQTPGAVTLVTHKGAASTVAFTVVPEVTLPQVTAIALAQRSLAGGHGGGPVIVKV